MSAPELAMWTCTICQGRNGKTDTACRHTAAHPTPVDRPVLKNQAIPDHFAATLRRVRGNRHLLCATLAAAKREGWTLTALGEPIGLSRERVRQLILLADGRTRTPEIPSPPRHPAPAQTVTKICLRPTPEVETRLQEMAVIAATVNGGTAEDDPARAVSVEYTALLQALVDEGLTVYRLAKILGVGTNAIYSRLARHGYRKPMPSQDRNTYTGRKSRGPGSKAGAR